MKGPFERLKYDGRRVWECPACNNRQHTACNVTTCLCPCQRKVAGTEQTWMKLVEDGVRRIQ